MDIAALGERARGRKRCNKQSSYKQKAHRVPPSFPVRPLITISGQLLWRIDFESRLQKSLKNRGLLRDALRVVLAFCSSYYPTPACLSGRCKREHDDTCSGLSTG